MSGRWGQIAWVPALFLSLSSCSPPPAESAMTAFADAGSESIRIEIRSIAVPRASVSIVDAADEPAEVLAAQVAERVRVGARSFLEDHRGFRVVDSPSTWRGPSEALLDEAGEAPIGESVSRAHAADIRMAAAGADAVLLIRVVFVDPKLDAWVILLDPAEGRVLYRWHDKNNGALIPDAGRIAIMLSDLDNPPYRADSTLH